MRAEANVGFFQKKWASHHISSCSRYPPTAFIMSGPLIDLIVELFREYVDDPAPVATAEYIDGSVNYEDLSYAAYRFRLHFIPLPDSVLITSVEKHPDQKDTSETAALFTRLNREFKRLVPLDQNLANTLHSR